jgi:hypothetical protein
MVPIGMVMHCIPSFHRFAIGNELICDRHARKGNLVQLLWNQIAEHQRRQHEFLILE